MILNKIMYQKNANFCIYLMGFLYSGGQVLKSAKEVDWWAIFFPIAKPFILPAFHMNFWSAWVDDYANWDQEIKELGTYDPHANTLLISDSGHLTTLLDGRFCVKYCPFCNVIHSNLWFFFFLLYNCFSWLSLFVF